MWSFLLGVCVGLGTAVGSAAIYHHKQDWTDIYNAYNQLKVRWPAFETMITISRLSKTSFDQWWLDYVKPIDLHHYMISFVIQGREYTFPVKIIQGPQQLTPLQAGITAVSGGLLYAQQNGFLDSTVDE